MKYVFLFSVLISLSSCYTKGFSDGQADRDNDVLALKYNILALQDSILSIQRSDIGHMRNMAILQQTVILDAGIIRKLDATTNEALFQYNLWRKQRSALIDSLK